MVVEENRGYELFLCDTKTGSNIQFVTPADVTWDVKLNAAGKVQTGLPILGTLLDLRLAAQSVRRAVGIAYNGNILECGPIWERDYDPADEKLDLTAEGLWSIFDRRKAIRAEDLAYLESPNTPRNVATKTWTITKGSLGAIAREMVRNSISNNGQLPLDNAGYLNILLPPDIAGTAAARTYYGYDLAWMGTRLRELTTAGKTAPDIRFRPRFNTDRTLVEWVMEVGTPQKPLLQQTGADWRWNVSLEKSGAVHLKWKEDARSVASRAWYLGAGQDKQKKIVSVTDVELCAQGWPWTEVDDSTDVDSLTVLTGHAQKLLEDSKYPWITWDLTVRADVPPLLGTYQPGDWVTLTIPPGHPQIAAGDVRVRIMGISGNESETVKLTVAPIQGRY